PPHSHNLPLHDALPIYRRQRSSPSQEIEAPCFIKMRRKGKAENLRVRIPYAEMIGGGDFKAVIAGTKIGIMSNSVTRFFAPTGIDRKSTRLNSSHRTIS